MGGMNEAKSTYNAKSAGAKIEDLLVSDIEMSKRDWGIDVLVALATFLLACGELLVTSSSIVIPDLALSQYLGEVTLMPNEQAYFAVALTTLPLVFRRRMSIVVFVFCMAAFLFFQSLFTGIALPILGPAVALSTVVLVVGIKPAIVCALAAAAGVMLAASPNRTATLAFFMRFQNIIILAGAVVAGYAYRTHKAYVRAVEQRADAAERTREEEAARRVEAERVRIAREVHDITAHSLSAVSIQAAAAERLVDRDPAAAKEAIGQARATAKSALDDIRSMVGVLRHGNNVAPVAPTVGTDHLSDLQKYLQDAGVEATLHTQGYVRAAVPGHVDVALYGIAREACTNIVKHAQATKASITLTQQGTNAVLAVADNGKGCAKVLDSDGHGIEGMRERAALLGGTVSVGPAVSPEGAAGSTCAGEGFRVEVVLPLNGRGLNHGQ